MDRWRIDRDERDDRAELGAQLETAIATITRIRNDLEQLGRILPSIVANAESIGAKGALERIVRAAMSPADLPSGTPMASPGKPATRRPGRRAGGGAVQQQMLAVADAAEGKGLGHDELPGALAIQMGRPVPRSSYRGALAKLLELGALVERGNRIFSAAHANAAGGEEVPPEPVQAVSGGDVQSENPEGGDVHAAAIADDEHETVPATGTYGRSF